MASATLLLPARSRFGGQRLSEATGRGLARADLSEYDNDEPLRRVLDVLPRGWPVAAATRQRDVGDAAHALWLRADPAYIRPDINGARLLAYGQALSLDAAESAELLKPLKPLFGDAGFPIDAPVPSRWYLRLPSGVRLPELVAPEQALGTDVFEQLPDGAEGRRWRALLSEAQVMLHNHPLNQQRIAAGRAPVNSLWFWGGGALPDRVRCEFDHVASDDETLTALAALAGTEVTAQAQTWKLEQGASLYDLRDTRDLQLLERNWFAPLLAALVAHEIDRVDLDFGDGAGYRLTRGQRWRLWRRPLRSFVAAPTPGDTA